MPSPNLKQQIAAERYHSISYPSSSQHLWRYTPFRTIHPSDSTKDLLESVPIHVEVAGGTIEEIDVARNKTFLQEIDDKGLALNIALNTIEREIICSQETKISLFGNSEVNSCRLNFVVPEKTSSVVTVVNQSINWCGLIFEGVIPPSSKLEFIFVDISDSNATILRHDGWILNRDSNLVMSTLSLGGLHRKSHLMYRLDGKGSSLEVGCASLGKENRHDDHHFSVIHNAPYTHSKLRIHSSCSDSSKSVGTGLLILNENASGADAGQIFRNLMLSDDATAESIPELEVFVNDVSATHGAASAPIDSEHLMYLNSRGLSPEDATNLITEGFLLKPITDIISVNQVEDIRDYLLNHF